MSEKMPGKIARAETVASIESTANFEGNDSEVLLERVQHPRIKEQIIETIYRAQVAHWKELSETMWVPHHEEWMGEREYVMNGQGVIYSKASLEEELAQPPSREDIAEKLQERWESAATFTPVEFSNESPSMDAMTMEWEMPESGQRPSTKQLSIAEAHEKGHQIRDYGARNQFLKEWFGRGFDPHAVSWEEEDAEKRQHAEAYLFSAMELAERMNQLKNYFGMRGDEQFMKAHLDYARAHYVTDTGLDNAMTHFFQAITPETETAFLELINTAGI